MSEMCMEGRMGVLYDVRCPGTYLRPRMYATCLMSHNCHLALKSQCQLILEPTFVKGVATEFVYIAGEDCVSARGSFHLE
jgi:hypothetical protein